MKQEEDYKQNLIQKLMQDQEKGALEIEESKMNLVALPEKLEQEKMARELGIKQTQQVIDYYPQKFALEEREQNLKAQKLIAQTNAIKNPVSEESKAFAKESGKNRAKAIASNTEKIMLADNINVSLGELQQIREANPELFKQTVGPFAGLIKGYTGTPEQKTLLAQIDAASGNVMLDTLKMMKGQSSDKEMREVKDIKPNKTDSDEAYVAKTQTLLKVNNQISKRLILSNQLIENGYSESQAADQARKVYPIDYLIKEAKAAEKPKEDITALKDEDLDAQLAAMEQPGAQ
jgi:hypothetical protein